MNRTAAEKFAREFVESLNFVGPSQAAALAIQELHVRNLADIIERACGQDAVLCAAKHSDTGANDPQDCDWPFCGCDPKADKVIEAIQESGFTLVKDEHLLKMTKAAERAAGETAWVSVEAIEALITKWRKAADRSNESWSKLGSEDESNWATELETNKNDLWMCADQLTELLPQNHPEI